MKTAIVYKSFFGTTKQYAYWLQEELKSDVLSFSQANNKKLASYDQIIVASGIYAGWMPLTGFLKRKWAVVKDKKVVVLAVGIASPNTFFSKKVFEKIPVEIRQKIRYFKVPGKMFKTAPAGPVAKENLKEIIAYIKKNL